MACILEPVVLLVKVGLAWGLLCGNWSGCLLLSYSYRVSLIILTTCWFFQKCEVLDVPDERSLLHLHLHLGRQQFAHILALLELRWAAAFLLEVSPLQLGLLDAHFGALRLIVLQECLGHGLEYVPLLVGICLRCIIKSLNGVLRLTKV